jgi:murein DD-endopeptidase MepM/ murein hydrolase activator NlpD
VSAFAVFAAVFCFQPIAPAAVDARIEPLVRTVDLDVGARQTVTLCDGTAVVVELLELTEKRDSVRNAVRSAQVKVNVDGHTLSLVSCTYHLPMTAGRVQIDCPVTRGYVANSSKDNAWGLLKDARLRLWPAGSPWIREGTFAYPVNLDLFSGDTQMANVPCYVDGGELPDNKNIYYHYGLDFGGSEGLTEVVAATDGLVISAGDRVLDGCDKAPVEKRYDVVYILDDRGWFCRYSHLQMIASPVIPGKRVKMGQLVGRLGKEGGSGGWSHLHLDIQSLQPSGLWGAQDAYPFMWQAFQRQHHPAIIAIARPHHLVFTGEPLVLDASKSWTPAGDIAQWQWILSDGTTAKDQTVPRVYDTPGEYSEILKITDSVGNVDYDFAVVQVIDKSNPDRLPPTINANFFPTSNLQAGERITFKVRSFRTKRPKELWDFGDGTPPVTVYSDGNADMHNPDGYAVTHHRYEKPGHYIATVTCTNENDYSATARLHVHIGSGAASPGSQH